jgi:tRNA dimethylallyltransferase
LEISAQIDPKKPVVIAGPTASGKSALALQIAQTQGGVVVNADALQVWDCWRVLSARPSLADEAAAPHLLYGHKSPGQDYSVGHWLRDLAPVLADHAAGGPRPIIVGGTGLYLSALTEGLAEIPATPAQVRTLANRRLAAEGAAALLAELDPPPPGSTRSIPPGSSAPGRCRPPPGAGWPPGRTTRRPPPCR